MKKPIKSELIRYSVFPSVVEADKESVVCIESHDNRMLFCDDVVYDVEFIPSDISDVPHDDKMSIRGYEKNRKKYTFRPENGVLKIKHFFSEEQKWTIHICTKEYSKCDNPLNKLGAPHFEWYRQFPERGVYLEIYSLKPDLYNKRVLRGDLHVHTSLTDGNDSPWLVATEYRRAGYDFIAITDHNLYDVSRYARDRINFKTDFKVLTGEEIHNGFGGHLHILNIGGKKKHKRHVSERAG